MAMPDLLFIIKRSVILYYARSWRNGNIRFDMVEGAHMGCLKKIWSTTPCRCIRANNDYLL